MLGKMKLLEPRCSRAGQSTGSAIPKVRFGLGMPLGHPLPSLSQGEAVSWGSSDPQRMPTAHQKPLLLSILLDSVPPAEKMATGAGSSSGGSKVASGREAAASLWI